MPLKYMKKVRFLANCYNFDLNITKIQNSYFRMCLMHYNIENKS